MVVTGIALASRIIVLTSVLVHSFKLRCFDGSDDHCTTRSLHVCEDKPYFVKKLLCKIRVQISEVQLLGSWEKVLLYSLVVCLSLVED